MKINKSRPRSSRNISRRKLVKRTHKKSLFRLKKYNKNSNNFVTLMPQKKIFYVIRILPSLLLRIILYVMVRILEIRWKIEYKNKIFKI